MMSGLPTSMHLVNIRLLFGKAEMLHTLVFDAPQQVVAKEGVEDGMLEGRAVCVARAQSVDVGRIEEVGDEMWSDVGICDDSVVGGVARFRPFVVGLVGCGRWRAWADLRHISLSSLLFGVALVRRLVDRR